MRGSWKWSARGEVRCETQKVVDRHAMTRLTQLAIVTDTSVTTGVPMYKLFCNVMLS